jgi:hypothetical protein
MYAAAVRATLYLTPLHTTIRVKAGTVMEHTDWLDEGLSPADARFLMLTAITHHKFSSPAWGEHEVRKLHAELAELDRLAAQTPVNASATAQSADFMNVSNWVKPWTW